MSEAKISVSGMNCNHCKIVVESGLAKIEGIDVAIADIVNGEITVKGNQIDLERIKNTVEELGYKYSGEIRP